MIRTYLLFARITIGLSCGIPAIVWVYNLLKPRIRAEGMDLWNKFLWMVLLSLAAFVTATWLPKKYAKTVDDLSRKQKGFLRALPGEWVGWAIFLSAGLSLVLELALIRWQGTVFELFGFYKNFGLLACFVGLGLGYAMADRRHVPLLLSVPLLLWQMLLLIFTRYGPGNWNVGILRSTPVLEQLNMGVGIANTLREYVAVMLLLAITFMLTALAFIPIGQLCGALLQRRPKLQAYGLNLLGSLVGVVLFFAFSFLWTPPVIWFVVCFAALLAFQGFDRRVLVFGTACSLFAVVVLNWPVDSLWQRTYSPYQMLEIGPGNDGLAKIRAAGYYYQRILDLSRHRVDSPGGEKLKPIANYYELPYRIAGRPGDVAIVGAGTGNDVAAALRMDAKRVDAIEIDPGILAYGQAYHPEKPYHDPRVTPIVNDARSHLRQTERSYDLIAYGLLDSHTLLSHASNVRLDSFVYTVEGFRDARDRLKEDGVLSLSFCMLSPELGRKFYLMLQEAFDGRPPVCIRSKYDGAITFLQRKGSPLQVDSQTLATLGFADKTAKFADPSLKTDISTDDWPFMYMPRRTYPISYLAVVGLILALSLGLTKSLTEFRPHSSNTVFFLLGAGFMLIETKSITELGLVFGNTWQVIGIVIIGILSMAFVANCAVQWLKIRGVVVPYLLLLVSVVVGLIIAKNGGFASNLTGRLTALIVLTCPIFFSGIVFSTMLKYSKSISGAMAANLVGVTCGGLLEYNSMYFGFAFLYWVTFALYGAALVVSLLSLQSGTVRLPSGQPKPA